MNIQQLNAFITVAKMQHLSHAAEILNISQPALSKSISSLEQELGTRLFDRVGRSIELNEYGKIFLPYASSVISCVDKGKQAIDNARNNGQNSVTLLTAPFISTGLLNAILKVCPTPNFLSSSVDPASALHEIIHKNVDLLILSKDLYNQAINKKVLYSEKIMILLSAAHPLSNHNEIDLYDVTDYRFVMLNQNTGLHNAVAKKCAADNINLKVDITVDNVNDVFEYINTDKYISIVGENIFDHYHGKFPLSSYKLLQISNCPFMINRCLYWRANETNESILNVKDAILTYFQQD